MVMVFFFFSSRRRHTRWNCDWSSDVCSSDLCRLGACAAGLDGGCGAGTCAATGACGGDSAASRAAGGSLDGTGERAWLPAPCARCMTRVDLKRSATGADAAVAVSSSVVPPSRIWSPSLISTRSMRPPFTKVPLVEPRSSTHTRPSAVTNIRACRRDTPLSAIPNSRNEARPRTSSRSTASTWPSEAVPRTRTYATAVCLSRWCAESVCSVILPSPPARWRGISCALGRACSARWPGMSCATFCPRKAPPDQPDSTCDLTVRSDLGRRTRRGEPLELLRPARPIVHDDDQARLVGKGHNARAYGSGRRSGRAHAVVQVGHPVALDDQGVVEQHRRVGVLAEEPDARTEHDGNQRDGDLVDEAGRDRLPGEVAGGQGNVPVAGKGLGLCNGAGQPVGDERERRVRKAPAGRHLVGHGEYRVADGRAAVPAVRQVRTGAGR